MTNRIVLVGNPNTGKTTLFNSLTGKKEKTANYSGVTVKEKETLVKIKNNEYSIVDLPGLYSFYNENTEDEVRASSYIEQNKESIFCFVMTDLSIQKNLYLLTELSKKVYKVVIFINQMQKKKVNIDIRRIQEETGVLIIYESAKTIKNIVLKEIYNFDFKHNRLNQYSCKNLLSLFNFEKVKKQKIDAFLLHKFWGRIFAIFVFCFIVWFSYFSFGNFLGKHIFKIFTNLGDRLITKTGIDKLFTSYLYSVLFVSCGAVISFLPQLVFLLFSMYLLEESGYLPRISYLFNDQLEKINLNGRSIFSLVVGVGCTTSGYLLTKNVPNSTRKNCAKLIPFVGCSAKFPILIFFAGFISNFISAIYVLMVFILVVFFGSLYLFATGSRDEEDFILEIPRIKMPRLKECLKKCLSLSLDFLKRVLGIVFLASSILWLLKNITIDFSFEENSPKSILNMIAGVVKILFKPIGLDDNNIIISL